jgi:hypothetical protein
MSARSTQDRTASYQLACGTITAMPLIYMVLATALKNAGIIPPGGLGDFDPEAVPIISMALLVGGTVSSTASIAVKKILLKTLEARGQDAGARFKIALISIALSESGAVMGLALMLLTGDLRYGGLLCGLSFAITCFHFPSRYWLEQGNPVV